jgi:hypothetical protein
MANGARPMRQAGAVPRRRYLAAGTFFLLCLAPPGSLFFAHFTSVSPRLPGSTVLYNGHKVVNLARSNPASSRRQNPCPPPVATGHGSFSCEADSSPPPSGIRTVALHLVGEGPSIQAASSALPLVRKLCKLGLTWPTSSGGRLD